MEPHHRTPPANRLKAEQIKLAEARGRPLDGGAIVVGRAGAWGRIDRDVGPTSRDF